MAKDQLLNIRVTSEWLEARKKRMKAAGYESLTAYVLAMISLAENAYDTIVNKEER